MSTGQGPVVALFGWEGNRRSGAAPAIRHRLWYSGIYLTSLLIVNFGSLTTFWATVCKTVRHMLSHRCLSVPSVLSCLSCL